MTTQKILQINPELFQFNGGKKSLKKKEKKTKPIQDKTQSLKSNKLKKELLKKVKDYQKNKETEVIKDEKSKEKNETMPGSNLFDSQDFENSDFEREFNKSLTFLHDLSKKNKDKNKKKTLKISNADINIDIPKDCLIYNSAKEPNYGCLKNGSKPTFRDLNKTQKHNTNNPKRLQLALENNIHYDHSEFHNKYQTNTDIIRETNKPNIELKIEENNGKIIKVCVNHLTLTDINYETADNSLNTYDIFDDWVCAIVSRCQFIEKDLIEHTKMLENLLCNTEEIRKNLGGKMFRSDNIWFKNEILKSQQKLDKLLNDYIWEF